MNAPLNLTVQSAALRLFFRNKFSNISETLKNIIMKQFKTIDLFISIALISGFTIYWLIKSGDSFLTGYCVTGCWQAISMLVHAVNRCFTYRTGSRYTYHWISLVSIITMPLGSIWILLFAAPFMAIYYTYLCYHEVYVKMQRPLSVLK